jgi:tetratricopeptide (TPR) repeat protein
MKQRTVNHNAIETIFYGLFIGAVVAFIFYLFHSHPVSYTIFLITEGQWGEYFTSISYGLSSMLLFALLFKPARRSQKVVWAMFGLTAFFIGAEEISWGQSILHIPKPSFFYYANLQNEVNIHNLKYLQNIPYHRLLAYFVLGWLIFSVTVSLWFPRLKNRVQTLGLPLIPTRIVIVFLTVPYFFLVHPVAKSDEIGELFLSIGVVVWASDIFIQYGWIKRNRGLWAVISIFGTLLFVAILSAGMAYRFPSDIGWRLNLTASRDYPGFGMYDQAESIYEYIYSHPEYMTPETMLNHARMLLKLGNKDKALHILTEAVNRLEISDQPENQRSSYLRSFGIVLGLLELSDRADAKFNQAIKVDKQQIELVSNQNAKAKLLWSIAKTLAARGDISAAIDTAKQARSKAISAQLHQQLDTWIKTLK